MMEDTKKTQRCWLFQGSPSPILVSHPLPPMSSLYDSKPVVAHKQGRPGMGEEVAHVRLWDLSVVVMNPLSPWLRSCLGCNLDQLQTYPGGSRENSPDNTCPMTTSRSTQAPQAMSAGPAVTHLPLQSLEQQCQG